MFIALDVSLEVIRSLREVVAVLRRKDPSLADQLQRAASSVALNVAEGSKRVGKDRAHFNRIAAGSCAEVRAALALADAWGYLDELDVSTSLALLDRQAALIHRLVYRRSIAA